MDYLDNLCDDLRRMESQVKALTRIVSLLLVGKQVEIYDFQNFTRVYGEVVKSDGECVQVKFVDKTKYYSLEDIDL